MQHESVLGEDRPQMRNEFLRAWAGRRVTTTPCDEFHVSHDWSITSPTSAKMRIHACKGGRSAPASLELGPSHALPRLEHSDLTAPPSDNKDHSLYLFRLDALSKLFSACPSSRINPPSISHVSFRCIGAKLVVACIRQAGPTVNLRLS